MTQLFSSLMKVEYHYRLILTRFAEQHLILSFVGLFVGVPLLLICLVFAGTMILLLPLSWLMGWV